MIELLISVVGKPIAGRVISWLPIWEALIGFGKFHEGCQNLVPSLYTISRLALLGLQ